MPQMAPISWLILFLIFSLIFMMFNIVNYYCFSYNKKNTNESSKQKVFFKNLNWKW